MCFRCKLGGKIGLNMSNCIFLPLRLTLLLLIFPTPYWILQGCCSESFSPCLINTFFVCYDACTALIMCLKIASGTHSSSEMRTQQQTKILQGLRFQNKLFWKSWILSVNLKFCGGVRFFRGIFASLWFLS